MHALMTLLNTDTLPNVNLATNSLSRRDWFLDTHWTLGQLLNISMTAVKFPRSPGFPDNRALLLLITVELATVCITVSVKQAHVATIKVLYNSCG